MAECEALLDALDLLSTNGLARESLEAQAITEVRKVLDK
jgi:hypothetical protein